MKRVILSLIVIFLTVWFITSGQTDLSYVEIDANSVSIGDYSQTTYNVVKSNWGSEKVSEDYSTSYAAFEYAPLTAVNGSTYEYDNGVFLLRDQEEIIVNISVPEKALYVIAIDQIDWGSS